MADLLPPGVRRRLRLTRNYAWRMHEREKKRLRRIRNSYRKNRYWYWPRWHGYGVRAMNLLADTPSHHSDCRVCNGYSPYRPLCELRILAQERADRRNDLAEEEMDTLRA